MGNRDAPGVGLENSPGILLDFCASTDNSGNPVKLSVHQPGEYSCLAVDYVLGEGALDWDYAFPWPRREGLCVSQVSEIEINRTLVSPPVSRIAPPG